MNSVKVDKLYKLAMVQDGVETEQDLIHAFAQLIVDECATKLYNMDDNVQGNHNYYKHAALEVLRHFKGKE